jgi:hypothetical protein
MKTQKQIEAELKKYKILDFPDKIQAKGLYQGPAPLTEYAYNQDVGFKKALEWVLQVKTAK